MAKKTFALEMNGIEIKTLEDLREIFNLEQAVKYFKSGELLQWLEDRFYDDEAEAIEKISADDKNLSQKLCAALGVEYYDEEFTQRVREKKKFLMERTEDENIIDNAATTALNQDDLANLLYMDYQTIYLCGENFSVPIRVENKKYIGILSTPKIKIKASSQADLDAKNIIFENCKLPFEYSSAKKIFPAANDDVKNELPDMFEIIFGHRNKWGILESTGKISYSEPSPAQKKMFLKLVCSGEYNEEDLIYLCADKNFSAGWALTKDAFCVGGTLKFSCCDIKAEDSRYQPEIDSKIALARRRGRKKILYSDIREVVTDTPKVEDFYRKQQSDFFDLFPNAGFNFGGKNEQGIIFIDNTRRNNDGAFFRETFAGTMMIADNQGIYWNVLPERKSDNDFSMMIKLLRGNELPGRESGISGIWNNKIEAKVAKFLNFAKE